VDGFLWWGLSGCVWCLVVGWRRFGGGPGLGHYDLHIPGCMWLCSCCVCYIMLWCMWLSEEPMVYVGFDWDECVYGLRCDVVDACVFTEFAKGWVV
jgi:hypothetical protein